MKPLLGILFILSGLILAIPQIYEALRYVDIDQWPIIQGILGLACITAGIFTILFGGKRAGKRIWTEM